jgi:PKD repeat protein
MKKLIISSILSIGLLFIPLLNTNAQTIDQLLQEYTVDSDGTGVLFTEIIAEDFNDSDSPSIFKANPQFSEDKFNQILYRWNFGDGNSDFGKEVVHTYNAPGLYEVQLTVVADNEEWETTKEIFIAEQTALMITDSTEDADQISNFVRNARTSNYYIKIVESFASQSEFLSEEILTRKLIKIGEEVKNYDTIIVWSDNTSPLNALARYTQNLEQQNPDTIQVTFSNKPIILLKNDLDNLQRETRIFNQIQPREVIAIQEAQRYMIPESLTATALKQQLIETGVQYEAISTYETTVSPFNIFSFFIDYLINQGIPDNTIILILLLPVIATIIAFFKQVIGASTMGIYMPSIITMAFLILGLKFGLITFLFIVATGVIAHKILNPFKLLYVPKMALVITTVSITLFILITFTVYLNIFAIEFISLTIFPVLVMGTLTERFARLTSTKGFKGSAVILTETVLVCIITYFLTGGVIDLYFTDIQFTWMRNIILNYPEIILVFIGVNAYLGRWTGLQLSEVLRFRNILNDLEE